MSLKFVTVILIPDSWFLLYQIFRKVSYLVVKSTCGPHRRYRHL